MTKITYIDHDGSTTVVEAREGASVMETAVENEVPGILGDCGGSCSCATCHVIVDAAWVGLITPISPGEEALLSTREDRTPTSRLGCQIRLGAITNNIVVHTPESQY